MDKKKEFKVAVAGYGHVGKDTVKTIIENNSIMENRTGIKLTVKTIFSRNIDKVQNDKFLDKVEIKTKDLKYSNRSFGGYGYCQRTINENKKTSCYSK